MIEADNINIPFDERLTFLGEISLDGEFAALTFHVTVTNEGAISLDFDRIEVRPEHIFILTKWQGNEHYLTSFTLVGAAERGIEFQTESLSFTSLGKMFSQRQHTMSPKGQCSDALMRFRRQESRLYPRVVRHLRGFQSFQTTPVDCDLGVAFIAGLSKIEMPNQLSGYIGLDAKSNPDNMDEWCKQANALHDHIRLVMSFAAGTVLKDPISEYYLGDTVEVRFYSQGAQTIGDLRTIHYLDQGKIFEAAVNSHFNPVVEANDLFHAITWFTMDATFDEARLTNAMTAVENLLSANLPEEESIILPRKIFEKVRKDLRAALKSALMKHAVITEEKASEIAVEMNQKFGDLNRKTLLEKLHILCEKWNVPINDIETIQRTAAKQARDHIIHQGKYQSAISGKDVWDHLQLVREITVRMIFTVIGYKGRYISMLGGHHWADFPPAPDRSNEEASAFEAVGAQPPAPLADNNAEIVDRAEAMQAAAIDYAITLGAQGADFLHSWRKGNWVALKEEWPDFSGPVPG